MKNWKEILSNYPYLIWVLFYATLFWLIFGATMQSFWIVFTIYIVCMVLSLTPFAEWIWQKVLRVRKPATQEEKDKVQPLFDEVYEETQKIDKNLFKNIQLYIQEDMDINAFAFGQRTLILTRGSIQLLSEEQLKGFIAHEFGHFSHYDTVALLFAHVSNILMSIFLKFVYWIANIFYKIGNSKDEIVGKFIKLLYNVFMWIYNGVVFIGDLILMNVSRKHEYLADSFAHECGYGAGLISGLYALRQISLNEPSSVIEQLRSTHPPLVNRIERLEGL